ncbi:MAG TPA: hypothetical protein VGB59_08540 [Allosphingosinicella sp.]|jgi:hypothetical protein
MKLFKLALAALAVAATPAAAQVLKAPPATLDPAKAYALVELRNVDGKKAAGTLVLARYDAEGGDVRGGTRSPGSALAKGVPVRVTIAGKPLVKSPGSRLYLVALEPDTWVIEGSGGTAFSLGSNRFAVAAGDIVDLGVVTPRTDWREGDGPEKITAGKVAKMALLGGFAMKKKAPTPMSIDLQPRGGADMPLPATLKAQAVPASYVPGAKFGNYLGGLVNRLDGRKGRPGADAAPADEVEGTQPSS